tara:strand:+ start:52 stop:534 length:483 start_codon:yes stop_codon:yes gene_type:complete
MVTIPPINPISAVTTLFGLLGTKKQFDYQKAEAERRAALGVFDARQKVNELFLAKAQAISESNRRIEEMERVERQNIAMFSAKIASSDRSVGAFLKKNRQIVGQDLEDLERRSNLTSAKFALGASLDYKYGQSASSGIRAEATANLYSNMARLLQNLDIT